MPHPLLHAPLPPAHVERDGAWFYMDLRGFGVRAGQIRRMKIEMILENCSVVESLENVGKDLPIKENSHSLIILFKESKVWGESEYFFGSTPKY